MIISKGRKRSRAWTSTSPICPRRARRFSASTGRARKWRRARPKNWQLPASGSTGCGPAIENGVEFDPDRECLYADRLRQREPGDDTLGLSPHVDGGSVERWLDPGYRKVYRHLLSGDVGSYDPFDAAFRTVTKEIPSPAVCSMFRTYQGWTALSRQGPGDGTLNLVPIANAMGWVILRALQDDVPEDELCGAAPSRALTISNTYTPSCCGRMADTGCRTRGHGLCIQMLSMASRTDMPAPATAMLCISAPPVCAKNEKFLPGQRHAFEAGQSSPDFAAENYEVDFEGRFTADMLSPLGRLQMGYDV